MSQPAAAPRSATDTTHSTTTTTGTGVLQGTTALALHTPPAVRLFHGRKSNDARGPIIGLRGFADRLRSIWRGARDDDPYADWYLVRIDTALDEAHSAIRTSSEALQAQLAHCGLTVSLWASTTPCEMPLTFKTPYAYRAAMLLGDYDALVRTVRTAHGVGLLNTQAMISCVHLKGRILRRLFQEPCTYRATGLTRSWVSVNPLAVCQAQTRMGPLPADILANERRPAFMPFKAADPGAAERQEMAHYHQVPALDPQNHDSSGPGL